MYKVGEGGGGGGGTMIRVTTHNTYTLILSAFLLQNVLFVNAEAGSSLSFSVELELIRLV